MNIKTKLNAYQQMQYAENQVIGKQKEKWDKCTEKQMYMHFSQRNKKDNKVIFANCIK